MHFTKNEWLALLVAIVLAATGMLADNMPLIVVGWVVVGLTLCYIIASHDRIHISFRILLCTLVVALDAALIYALRENKIDMDSHRPFGTMYPGHIDTSTLVACQPPSIIAIYIGANIDCVTHFPLPLLEIDGDPIITLDRNADGQIVITYLLLNDVNEFNLAAITGNNYWTNPNVRKEISHDRDNLIVFNTRGDRAMVVEFMNPYHISISGEFYHHGYHLSIGRMDMTADIPVGKKVTLSDDMFYNHQIHLTNTGLLMFTTEPGATNLFTPATRP
jgi:hypothetical protein